jgi:hypothetical protein
MAYHYSKKLTCEEYKHVKPAHLTWRKGGAAYQVRSDAGNLNTRFEDFATLTEARRVARKRAMVCGWAEVFRWAESGVILRKIAICVYERELHA